MNSWIVVCLGVIALGSLVQVGFLVTLSVLALRTARRAAALQERAQAELRGPLRHVSETARIVRDISDIVAEEARTLRAGAQAAAEEVREARADVLRTVRAPWVEVHALAKGVARAASVMRSMSRSASTP